MFFENMREDDSIFEVVLVERGSEVSGKDTENELVVFVAVVLLWLSLAERVTEKRKKKKSMVQSGNVAIAIGVIERECV